VKAGDPAPDFALPRLGGPKAGEVVTLSSLSFPKTRSAV
jgi:hypothetical protein